MSRTKSKQTVLTSPSTLNVPTVIRAVLAGCLVFGSKAAAVLKSSGSAAKIGSLLLGGAGAAAAYNGNPADDDE